MTFAFWAVLIPIAILVVTLLAARFTPGLDQIKHVDAWFAGICLAALIWLVFGGALFVGGLIGQKVNTDICARFEAETGLEAKFVLYNHLTMDCLVRTADGWVPKDSIRKLVDE